MNGLEFVFELLHRARRLQNFSGAGFTLSDVLADRLTDLQDFFIDNRKYFAQIGECSRPAANTVGLTARIRGAIRDDPTVDEMLREIYERRGRRLSEEV